MTAFDDWALTAAVFLPLIGAALMLLVPRQEEGTLKLVALGTALATAAVGVYLLVQFDYDRAGELQFVAERSWIDVIQSRYIVALDGISLPLLVLSMLIVVLCIAYSWDHMPEPYNPKAFLILILVLEVGMNGTFVAQDLILFFVFFEVVLLPMYFLIGVWGGENRLYAAIKFFLFTLFGSALMILSFLALFFLSGDQLGGVGTFDLRALPEAVAGVSRGTQILVFGGLFMGFAIKVPMFPFHTWLPDAHTQAPTVGSVILAAILLKLGTYGFVRIAIPILPEAAIAWAPWIGGLAVIGIIYGALGCLAQSDMKRLIAFSSVAHMGYVMLGISTLTDFGINAAVFGMVAHGLITGMLFFVAGSIKDRFHTLEISRLGGLLLQAPRMGWILGFCAMASLGLPGLAGFWGEFPAILSAYNPAPQLDEALFRGYMVVAAIGTVFAAGYLLWMLQRVAFGTPKEEWGDHHISDMHAPEYVAWVPLLVLIVVLGLLPGLLFGVADDAVQTSLEGLRALNGADVDAAFVAPVIDWHAIAPELVLTAGLVVLLVADLLFEDRNRWATSSIAGIGLLATLVPILTLGLDGADRPLFGGAYVVDDFSLVLKALFLLSAYVVVLLSTNYIGEGDYHEGEYYFLVMSSVLGMVMMASARDLVSIFIALELLSIPAFLLAGWRKRDLRGNEASLKYYLLGVFASGVMLYGMSFVFGLTGSTLLTDIRSAMALGDDTSPLLTLAITFVLIGFAFKISAVPFHTWAPDTYEGAPTPITAFLSVASKAAGFVALLELVFVAFFPAEEVWQPLFWVLAALTMTVGNLIALRQTNIVRLLAYSSVAQAGFILVPFAVAGEAPEAVRSSFEAVVTYLLIYTAMNLGAFAVVITAARKTRSGEISSFGGLFQYAPGLTVLMTVFLFALAGIPPLAGWYAKFVVFRSVIDAGTPAAIVLGVLVALNSVVALFYYANIAREMWMMPVPDEDRTPVRVPPALAAALALTAAATIVLGFLPGLVGDLARLSVFEDVLAAIGG